MRIKNIIGIKFGKLTVIKMSDIRGNSGKIRYECLCDCGNSHEVGGDSLRCGKSKSCGCLAKEMDRSYKIKDREYATWKQLYNSTTLKISRRDKYTTDIQLSDFIMLSKLPCYYCGLENSNFIKDRIKKNDLVIKFNGLDRIDSNNGYYLSNVVPCCKYCNCSKNTMTQDEFKNFIIRLYHNYIAK